MARDPRYFRPNTLVEVTTVAFQNRFLLRPSDEVNDLILGVWGLAQRKFEMLVVAFVALSSHYHALLIPRDPKHLADFMEFVNGNVAKELGRLHGWEGQFWHDRYHLIPVSDEEDAQMSRLSGAGTAKLGRASAVVTGPKRTFDIRVVVGLERSTRERCCRASATASRTAHPPSQDDS